MGKLMDLLTFEHIVPSLKANTQFEAFEEMAAILANDLNMDPGNLVKALNDRESAFSTALEKTGVAIPHARIKSINEFGLLFGRSEKGVDFQAEDHKPSHLFFMIVGPEDKPSEYLRLLARVARLCHNEEFRASLRAAETAENIRDIITEEDSKG